MKGRQAGKQVGTDDGQVFIVVICELWFVSVRYSQAK